MALELQTGLISAFEALNPCQSTRSRRILFLVTGVLKKAQKTYPAPSAGNTPHFEMSIRSTLAIDGLFQLLQAVRAAVLLSLWGNGSSKTKCNIIMPPNRSRRDPATSSTHSLRSCFFRSCTEPSGRSRLDNNVRRD